MFVANKIQTLVIACKGRVTIGDQEALIPAFAFIAGMLRGTDHEVYDLDTGRLVGVVVLPDELAGEGYTSVVVPFGQQDRLLLKTIT